MDANEERIADLEDQLRQAANLVLASERTVSAQERTITEQNARIDDLTAVVQRQAAQVANANRAKNYAERNAAAILLEAAPSDQKEASRGTAATFEVSKQTYKKISPETRLVVHVHTADCDCPMVDGARVTATTK